MSLKSVVQKVHETVFPRGEIDAVEAETDDERFGRTGT
jgi:hypothetical protein